MKLIDKIHSLLQSTDLNDILIAIAISYQLPFEEFDSLFNEEIKPGILPNHGKGYYFIRESKIYFMGSDYLGRSDKDYMSLEEFEKAYSFDNYINLTPDIW